MMTVWRSPWLIRTSALVVGLLWLPDAGAQTNFERAPPVYRTYPADPERAAPVYRTYSSDPQRVEPAYRTDFSDPERAVPVYRTYSSDPERTAPVYSTGPESEPAASQPTEPQRMEPVYSTAPEPEPVESQPTEPQQMVPAYPVRSNGGAVPGYRVHPGSGTAPAYPVRPGGEVVPGYTVRSGRAESVVPTRPERSVSGYPTIAPEALPSYFVPLNIEEEELSGWNQTGGQAAPLSQGTLEQMIDRGLASVVLQLAEKNLRQGGAPLAAAHWLSVKGAALSALGNYDEARSLLENLPARAFEQAPNLILLLGDVLRRGGRFQEARVQYARFLNAHPDPSGERLRAQQGIIWTALDADNLDEAELQLRLYDEETSRPAPDIPFLELQAALAERRGDLDGAQQALETIWANQTTWRPDAGAVADRLARRLAEKGALPEAESLWQRLLERTGMPSGIEGHVRLAWSGALAVQQRWPDALQQLEWALAHDPDNRAAREHHAALFLEWAGLNPPASSSSVGDASADVTGDASADGARKERMAGADRDGSADAVSLAAIPRPAPKPKRKSSTTAGTSAQTASSGQCMAEPENLVQRLDWLKQLHGQPLDVLEQAQILGFWIDWERHHRLGLMRPNGLLTPEKLGLPEPLSEEARLLYAEAWLDAGEPQAALAALNGMTHPGADSLRLWVWSFGAPDREGPERFLSRPRTQDTFPEWRMAGLHALLRAASRNAWADVKVVQLLLTSLEKPPQAPLNASLRPAPVEEEALPLDVRRALRYVEAMKWRAEGKREQALNAFLALAFESSPGVRGVPEPWFPESPRAAADHMLAGMGLTGATTP